MKVYYINSGLQGCFTVRCLLPLVANGWDGDQTSIRLDDMTNLNRAQAAQAADIVVFHRPEEEGKLKLARLLKKLGKKIVFDNDDTAKHDGGFRFNNFMDAERVKRGLKTINNTLDTFIKEADLVTCSTQWLADEYKKINDNVAVLPNCIDPFYFDEPLRNETDVVRIGITGSLALTDDIDILEPIVKHFHNDPRVKIVLFSLPPNNKDEYTRKLYKEEYKFWESVNVEWQPLVPMEEYYDTLNSLKLDIMLIPRADNYFNRAKSNVKFLEAAMFEIPCFAQGFKDDKSPYQVNPKDKENLVLVEDNKDWIPEVEKMITDKKGRRKLGKKARNYVIENYSIEKRAHLWEEAYKKLL